MNHVIRAYQDYEMQMSSLGDSMEQDNPVRFIDALAEQLDCQKSFDTGSPDGTQRKKWPSSFESAIHFLEFDVYSSGI